MSEEGGKRSGLAAVGIFFVVWLVVHLVCLLATGGNAAISSPIGFVAGIIVAIVWYNGGK